MTNFTNPIHKYNIYHNYNKKICFYQASASDKRAWVGPQRPGTDQ